MLATLALPFAPAAAQRAPESITAGDRAYAALRPADALRHLQAAIAADSTSYEAHWKAARAIADVAKQIDGDDGATKRRRDSLYTVGRGYAEAAVRLDPDDADGHYVVAMVLGRLSRTKGSKERVRFARTIYDEATRAVELRPDHDGAHHVLGAWHAEVKRLSGIQRFFAKTLFGGGFMDQASWDKAIEHLERSVAINPGYVYHRLELAEVYVDRKRYSRARELLASIAPLPIGDVLDERYKRDAVTLLEDIRDKQDKAT